MTGVCFQQFHFIPCTGLMRRFCIQYVGDDGTGPFQRILVLVQKFRVMPHLIQRELELAKAGICIVHRLHQWKLE